MRLTLFFSLVLVGGLVGCGRQDEVTKYSVDVPQGPNEVQPAPAESSRNAAVGAAPSRMLAAIVPQGPQTWFFKLTGPDEAVGKQQERFAALVQSVQFAGETGQPAWDLPEGWRQRGASGMRFATIEIEEGEQTLELTVIPLGTMGNLDEYVLGNVNRWRGQLGLAPIAVLQPGDAGDASSGVRQFKLSDETLVTLVNLIGPGGGSEAAATVPRMADHPPIGGGQLGGGQLGAGQLGGSAVPSNGDATLAYDTPEGWSATKIGGMRRAAFEVVDGERQVEITVISLPQSGGERLANVNRWRQQIKLGDTTAEQLAQELEEIPLAAASGDYVELVGPAEASPREAILAVLADVAGSTWFFKLKGDADLAVRERERFKAFVRSVNLSPEAGGAADD